jgi:hypothetical protein
MSKRNGFRLIAGLAVVVAATLAFGASSPAAHHGGKKVYFADLFGGATKHPEAIFFTANSGPRVTDIHWQNWGKRKTVGRGHYEDNSALPCPPLCHPEGPAKIVLTHPKPCKQPKFTDNPGETLYMYKRGTLSHPDTDTGETTVHSDIGDYSTYC